MICKKCGTTIDDNSTECKFCGTKYPENEAKNQPDPAEDSNVNDPDMLTGEVGAAADDVEYSGEDIDRMLDENEKNRRRQQDRLNAEKQKQLQEIEKRREQKKRKQIRNRFAIALAILVVLGGTGAGIYYLHSDRGGVPDVEVVTDVPQFTPDVVADAQTELPSEEVTDVPADAQATQKANWQSSGSTGSTGSTGTAGSSSTGSAAKGGIAAGITGGWTGNGTTAGGGTNKSSAQASGSVSKQSGGSSGTVAAGSANQSSSTAAAGSKNTVSTSSAQPKAGAKYSAKGGYDGEKFSAALITGKEVMTGGSKKYMAFDFNGTTYYANIDSGSSTADVAGKPMTINAYKTSEVFNGVSVYEITALTKYNSSYVFPESGYRLLTEDDLKGKTARELYVGRNEIYARHGRQFADKSLQTYFNSCPWYKIKASYNTANDAANLNSIELANANFIKKYEESHQ